MTEIKWQEPPAERHVGKYDDIAAQLRANPGRWALAFPSAGASRATEIRKGRLRAFRPTDAFDVRATSNGDGNYAIYIRFIGEGGEFA